MAILSHASVSNSVTSWNFAEHRHGLHYILLVYLATLRWIKVGYRGKKRDAHRDLSGKPERKRPLQRHRCR
jgi:hypothetical protein